MTTIIVLVYVAALVVAIVWVIFPFLVIGRLDKLIESLGKIGILIRDDIVKKQP